MLLKITSSCNMMCPHCLDKCVPGEQHMDVKTFERAVDFAHNSGVRVVCVTGGEPSLNPMWYDMLNLVASEFMIATFVTNGEWLGTDKEEKVLELVRKHKNIKIQITSIRGLYRLHDETLPKVERFKRILKDEKIKHVLKCDTDKLNMLALGRAGENEEILKQTYENPNTMSCLAAALVSAQLPFKDAIHTLEMKGKFCHPLVDWQGKLHWSESTLCPHFATLDMKDEEIWEKARTWRPCCKCEDTKKLMEKTDPKYVAARMILGIGT